MSPTRGPLGVMVGAAVGWNAWNQTGELTLKQEAGRAGGCAV